MLLNKAATSECIVQDKYFTVTVNKKCYEDARAFFTRIEKNLSTNLFTLGSKCEPLNATDRLKIFHNFYRAGNEENFNLDFELLQNQGCDVRDYISPDSMDFNSDYMMINGQYCRTVFLRNYGTFVDDNIITELTSINKNLMLSIDFIPIPVDEANKDVDNILLGVQSDKANFNRRQAQNQNYGATNYDLEQREKEILEIRNDMRYRDQRIYDTIISMVITADSKQELDNLTESIFAKASKTARRSLQHFVINSLTDLILFYRLASKELNVTVHLQPNHLRLLCRFTLKRSVIRAERITVKMLSVTI